jgi:fluoroquinolone resistance protein
MSDCDFSEALFVKTNLSGANFAHAINYAIDATLNDIKKAKFMFPEAVGLLHGLDIVLLED